MKKIYISIIVAFTVVGTSCSPSLLDLNNPNALVAENSWNTQKDVEAGLVGVYHTLYNCYWNSFNAFQLSGQSDEFYSLSPDADLASYVNLKYTNYDQRWNINSWTYLYQSVFRSNQVIIYADRVEWESEVKKNQVVAQARAMRGMSYYNLAMLYKKAPIVDWISAPGDQPKEASFEELVDFIEKDFLFAAENLPAKWPEVGRFTKWFAYDFLGKLYMNSGQWEKAKAAFEKVIESKQFRLAPNYSDNFRHETNNNCESIFEIQNSDRNDTWGGFWGIANDGAVCSFTSRRDEFFAPSFGGGFGDYSVYEWLVDMYKDELDRDGGYDIRLRDNIMYPEMFDDFPGQVLYQKYTSWDPSIHGNQCRVRKYCVDYYSTGAVALGNNPIDIRILRYGETLLSYAECLVMVGGASAIPEAASYVNQIRERVNLYPLDESVHKDCLNSVDAFMKRLRIEREKEICFEYDRFIDLRRWGLGRDDEYTDEVKARSTKYKDNFSKGKEWLPIPRSDVDNNPNLTQNEGY